MSRPFLVLADLSKQLLPPLPLVPDTTPDLCRRSTDTALIIHRVAAFIRWVVRRLDCLSGTAPVIVAPLHKYRHAAQDKPHNLPRSHGDSAGTQSCKQGRQHIQCEDRLQADLHGCTAGCDNIAGRATGHSRSPILIEANALANLHVLRCLETDGAVPKLDQTFFSNCMYAVTHATGKQAVQFNVDKNASLAASHSLYSQELPPASTARETYIHKRREFCTWSNAVLPQLIIVAMLVLLLLLTM